MKKRREQQANGGGNFGGRLHGKHRSGSKIIVEMISFEMGKQTFILEGGACCGAAKSVEWDRNENKVKEKIMKKARVLIIGGGFAGLSAAKELDRLGISTLLVDRNSHHLFQPLLYQVATAGLSAPSVAAPLRHALRSCKNVQVIQDEVEDIDSAGIRAKMAGMGWMQFEAMLVAPGARHSYFGRDEWEQFAPGLKTLDDAMEMRARILTAFEEAEKRADEGGADAWMTFAIIGAGPTGVELAGSLSEIAKHALDGEFRSIDPSKARIVIIEGGSRPLAMLPESLSKAAAGDLAGMGVEVVCGARAVEINGDGLVYEKDGARVELKAKTVLWGAGVKASPLGAMAAKSTASPVDRSGRVEPLGDLSLGGAPMVFVGGDVASVKSAGQAVPGLAPAAKQMGVLAARNIAAKLAGGSSKEFVYADYGSLATIGRHKAVVSVGPLKFSGYLAWVFWLFAHIWFLIGWRNRFVVMADWAWAYWTKQRWARVSWGARSKRE